MPSGNGLGDTINSTTGTKQVGDGLKSVTGGVEDGSHNVGKATENAGQWKTVVSSVGLDENLRVYDENGIRFNVGKALIIRQSTWIYAFPVLHNSPTLEGQNRRRFRYPQCFIIPHPPSRLS